MGDRRECHLNNGNSNKSASLQASNDQSVQREEES